MFAAQAGNADAVKALVARGADVNAKEKVKGETALTFAAAYGRADVIRVLTAHRRGSERRRRRSWTSPRSTRKSRSASRSSAAAAGGPGRGRGGAAAPRSRAGRGRRGFNPNAKPGIDRQYNFTELVAYWGGLAPLHLAAREGQIEAVKALLEAGADVNQQTRRRQEHADAHRDDQRSLRSGEVAARQGCRPEPRAAQRRDAALRGAQLPVGRQGALSAAARLRAAADVVSRSDDRAARQGRRSRTPGSPRRSGTRSTTSISPASTKSARRRSGARRTPPTSTR